MAMESAPPETAAVTADPSGIKPSLATVSRNTFSTVFTGQIWGTDLNKVYILRYMLALHLDRL